MIPKSVRIRPETWRWIPWTALLVGFVAGCHREPTLVPIQGTVRFNGKPLEFGTVTFQPGKGQPAIGHLRPDGSFSMSSFKSNDGATIGLNKVRITCYESQNPAAVAKGGDQPLGKLLIPERYTFFDRSGLVADVKPSGNSPFLFELSP